MDVCVCAGVPRAYRVGIASAQEDMVVPAKHACGRANVIQPKKSSRFLAERRSECKKMNQTSSLSIPMLSRKGLTSIGGAVERPRIKLV